MTETADDRGDRHDESGPLPRPGPTLRTGLDVELAEAFHGVEKPVTVTRAEACTVCAGRGYEVSGEPVTCPLCDGRGRITHVRDLGHGRTQREEDCDRCGGVGVLPGPPCAVCEGDGLLERAVTVDVSVPAGIESGRTIRLDAAGAIGRHGGPRGDLLVDVDVGDHPRFAREGDDLRTRRALSFPQATFGASVEVPTLGSPVELTVPAGTQPGETFRLRGRGMPRFEATGTGDLLVDVSVVTPEELTPAQRAALEAYTEADDPDEGT